MKKRYLFASAIIASILCLVSTGQTHLIKADTNSVITEQAKTQSFDFTKYTDNFKTNELIPEEFAYIKVPKENNAYLQVKPDGSLSFIAQKKNATTFAIYESNTYAKIGYPISPTIQIQNTKTGKFLTIQSYKDNGHYFDKINDKDFLVTCDAPSVGWNERFNFNLSADKKHLTISSHLDAIRDQQGAGDDYQGGNSYYLHSNGTQGLIGSSENKDPQNFVLEQTNQKNGKIQLTSQIQNNKAIIYWHSVSEKDTTRNYKINKTTKIKKKGDLFSATVPLSKSKKAIQVNYCAGKTKLKGKTIIRDFRHPGVRLTNKQLDVMKKHITRKEEPWYSDYLMLKNTVANNVISYDYKPQFALAIGRGDKPSSGNIGYLEQSGNAAYFNVLEWVITGNKRYAEETKRILNTWSNLQILDGRDRILGAGLNCVKLATAADILSSYKGGYAGYSQLDLNKLQNMMVNVMYPVLQDDGIPMLANGNWDLAADEGTIAIGVLDNDYDIYKQAIDHMTSPYINGSLENYIDRSGQTQESGRDMAHAQLGVGLTAEVLNTAKIQGNDLLTKYDNRLAKASEWVAQYNLTNHAPSFKTMNNIFGKTDKYSYWTKLDEQTISRGEFRPIYEEILAIYEKKNVNLPWTSKAASAMRPQGMINNDNYNFDTLAFYKGPQTEKPEPVFNLRTRIQPWYNRQLQTGNEKEQYEPYPSYFSVNNNNYIVADKYQKDADLFQLIQNQDNSYSIFDLKNRRYLGVENDSNRIVAKSNVISSNTKFKLISNGLGFYAIAPQSNPSHLLETEISDKSQIKNAELSLIVGKNSYSPTESVKNENRFIFMYRLR